MKLFSTLFLCTSTWNVAAAATSTNQNIRRRAQTAENLPEPVVDPGCFSATSTAWVESVGPVAMKNLEVGDRVLTKSGGFQSVYGFGHRQEDEESVFYQIYTDDGDPIELTGNHLVRVVQEEGKQEATRADMVRVGDQLIKDQQVTAISKITTTQKEGLYMPLTVDGTIVVNGILASNYVSIQDQAPTAVGQISSLLSPDAILHWWLSPYRMLCLGVSPSFCKGENKDESGILRWLLVGKHLIEFSEQQNWATRVFLLGIPTFVLFAAFNLWEAVLGGPALAPMVALVLVSGLSWLLQKRRSAVSAKKTV